MEALIADKGYDANYMVETAEAVNAEAVIPSHFNRKIPREYDKELYKERNLIESPEQTKSVKPKRNSFSLLYVFWI